MNNELLRLDKVSLSFDKWKTYVLKDISFSVAYWEVLSIIWLNGTWKTSLLKLIAWIEKLTSGKIIRNYKNLSYIPQKINIDSSFPISVREFIEIYNPKVETKEIENYLEKFQMQNFLDRNISSLSWWEFQKVLIISSLVSNPDLLLLDEPTSAVDLVSEKLFYDIIAEVKNIFPNIAIILVSHSINLVYKNSDKVICLHQDNFCCHWTPSEIKTNKKILEIFWDYVWEYEHNPHEKH